MKLAISGKGGVGKTTLAAFLARVYQKRGMRVIAVDADPDANLAQALGFEKECKIAPISEMKELIEERTGAKPGSMGGFFKLNPKVDDLPEKLAAVKDNICLMVMGTVKTGGSGCVCPESVLLKNLIQHLFLERKDVVIMDMEAGLEHLGRATAFAVDVMLVVVEPGQRSIETAKNIQKLASEIGIKKVAVVGCKIRNEQEAELIKNSLGEIPFLGYIPFDQRIIEADLSGKPPFETAPDLSARVEEIAQKIENLK
jgi:CO dehydrogenase maturation factor